MNYFIVILCLGFPSKSSGARPSSSSSSLTQAGIEPRPSSAPFGMEPGCWTPSCAMCFFFYLVFTTCLRGVLRIPAMFSHHPIWIYYPSFDHDTLVGGWYTNPSEKWWTSSVGIWNDEIPNIWETKMFQTTNHCLRGVLRIPAMFSHHPILGPLWP